MKLRSNVHNIRETTDLVLLRERLVTLYSAMQAAHLNIEASADILWHRPAREFSPKDPLALESQPRRSEIPLSPAKAI